MSGDPVALHRSSTVEQVEEAEQHPPTGLGADDRLDETGRPNQQGLGADREAERLRAG